MVVATRAILKRNLRVLLQTEKNITRSVDRRLISVFLHFEHNEFVITKETAINDNLLALSENPSFSAMSTFTIQNRALFVSRSNKLQNAKLAFPVEEC